MDTRKILLRFAIGGLLSAIFLLPPAFSQESQTEETVRGTSDTEAMAIYFDTPCGRVFVNISMRYNLSHRPEHDAALR